MLTCGTGWVPWGDFHRTIPNWQAVWVDLKGPHTAELPAGAPQATHLWAWSHTQWCRARIDGNEVVAGFLHPEGQCPLGSGECAPATTTPLAEAQSWAEAHIRVDTLRGTRWDLIDVVDGIAATYVRPTRTDR